MVCNQSPTCCFKCSMLSIDENFCTNENDGSVRCNVILHNTAIMLHLCRWWRHIYWLACNLNSRTQLFHPNILQGSLYKFSAIQMKCTFIRKMLAKIYLETKWPLWKYTFIGADRATLCADKHDSTSQWISRNIVILYSRTSLPFARWTSRSESCVDIWPL